MMHCKFLSKHVFKLEIIFSQIFKKKIPPWLSSSLNPLKSFRLDFIVSKDLRKEGGSDPELLFTSFRLDLSNFFSIFFLYRTLRSYTLSPLISFRLDDPWQSVLPPPSPLEMRSPEEMSKMKYESDDICTNPKINLFGLPMNPLTHLNNKYF